MVNMGELSATICVPFGAETVENDPCTVGTTRNYTAGTGNRQNTSAQAEERNRQAFQRRISQKTSRIHVAERETSQVFGAEPKTSGISGQSTTTAALHAWSAGTKREKLCGRVMNPKRGHLPNQIIANSEEIDSSSELSDAVPGRAEVR